MNLITMFFLLVTLNDAGGEDGNAAGFDFDDFQDDDSDDDDDSIDLDNI